MRWIIETDVLVKHEVFQGRWDVSQQTLVL